MLVIDEAHRAVGDYAYVFVAQQYHKKAKYPRILSLTASPGSDIEKIQEVHYLAGEDCLMIKLRVSDNTELETILRTKIANLDVVKDTKTFIALSTYKESAKIRLPETLE